MRTFLILLATLVAAPALAADCGSRNQGILVLQDWSANRGDFGSVDVVLKLMNTSEKQIRMVNATVLFTDALGGDVANLSIDPDLVVPPNGTVEEKGSWGAARLLKVRKQDVTTVVCVSAVLYEDGSKEEFK